VFHPLSHTSSKLFTTTHPITPSVASNSHSSPPMPNSNLDENEFSETSPMSDEAGIHYILPHPSLGLDKCQRIFELRLRKLVCSSIAHVQPLSHCLQLDLATSKGLRVPHNLIPSNLPLVVRDVPWTRLESIADVDRNLMSVCLLMIAKLAYASCNWRKCRYLLYSRVIRAIIRALT
jgi:hypothetical protein